MKNIAIGGFFHESNTFNPIVTGENDFVVFEGVEIYGSGDAFPLARGIVDFFRDKPDYNLIPLVFAWAVPNGEVDEAFYNRLKDRFFALLSEAPQVDAFVLALHGSMRVKHLGSAESDLLSAIKAKYPQVPVFCGLYMHATLTGAMLNSLTACVGFKTAPHTDAWETGRKAAEMAALHLNHRVSLSLGFKKLDCLIAGEKSETDCEPMRSLIGELNSLEREGKVVSASYLLGFPWADAQENGVTAIAVTVGDPGKASEYADFLAHKFIQSRADFAFSAPAYPPEEALKLALGDSCRPVFVSDSGDNPTAGSTGDNTTLIALLSQELSSLARTKKILVAGIFDPCAERICVENFGSEITLKVGGNFDTKHCQPVRLRGIPVKLVNDFGVYSSNLVLFRTAEFDLIITSKHIGFTGTELFAALEIDYRNLDVIVVKLGYLTEEFKTLAAKSYLALTQGCSDEVLARLEYSKKYDLI